MADPLAAIAAKLNGAKQQLDLLDKPIRQGSIPNVVETWTDRDRRGRVRVRVREVADVPDAWHVGIGECVYNMRSALDHLAYALNVVGSGEEPPGNRQGSEFPIFDSRAAYRGQRRVRGAANMIKCFPRGARARVERLQPYHRGKDPDTRYLWILRELANIDKHRRFLSVAPTNQIVVGPGKTVEGHAVTGVRHSYRRLKPNATIIWLDVPSLPRSVKAPKVDFGIGVEIEMERDSPAVPLPLEEAHEPAVFVLQMILQFIRERVIPEFSPYLGRLP